MAAVMAAFLSQNTDAPGQEDHLIVLFNSSQQRAHFTVPELLREIHWQIEVDTSTSVVADEQSANDLFELMGCSLRVMRSVHSRVGLIRSLLPV